jgi:hypothetical protein
VLRKDPADGELMTIPVSFKATRQQMAFVAALLLQKAVED